MKNLKTTFVLLALSFIALSSCKKEEKDLNENLSPVGSLTLPQNQQSIKLTPANTQATQQFKWTVASAEDGGLILYEVAFDRKVAISPNRCIKCCRMLRGCNLR